MQPAIILFAHGARDPEWAKPFHRIRELVNRRLPSTRIELAYLEFMQPDLSGAVDRLAAEFKSISIIPLFMAQGGHLRHEVPKLIESIRQKHPGLELRLSTPIGDVEAILQSIADWIFAEQRPVN